MLSPVSLQFSQNAATAGAGKVSKVTGLASQESEIRGWVKSSLLIQVLKAAVCACAFSGCSSTTKSCDAYAMLTVQVSVEPEVGGVLKIRFVFPGDDQWRSLAFLS
jgi:hypothetical protein